jgi:uncharacterized membrane-anchored protein
MIKRTILQGIVLVALVSATPLFAAEEAEEGIGFQEFIQQFEWKHGPTSAPLEDIAEIEVPEGFMHADAANTQRLLESLGNLISGSELGLLTPTNFEWFVVFRFSEDGYVKDDDKDKLDQAAMISSIREGNQYANEEKRGMGLPEMRIIGWEVEPKYDEATHNLEWAIRAESEGYPVVNYNSRVLGRRGIMEAKLVVDPEQLAATLPTFKELLAGYAYQPGQRYAEFKPGDKVAKYGLAALVTGAGVALAAKTGLLAWIAVFFKKAWKVIVIAVVAVGAFLKRLVVGRTEPRASEE